MELIREIREIKSDKITLNIPQEFRRKTVEILIFPLDKSVKGDVVSPDSEKDAATASGLCGIWDDEREPEEIAEDIYADRTGFGDRQVEL